MSEAMKQASWTTTKCPGDPMLIEIIQQDQWFATQPESPRMRKVELRACLTDSPGGLLRSVKRRLKCGQTKIVRNTRVMGDAIRATCGVEYHRAPVQGLLYRHCRYA